jgi:hypothetical protein
LETDDSRGNDVIAMISKLVINDSNSFKLALYYIFLEDTKYMTILTRQERERLVLDLYNQGKTYREISKEARISPRDIGVILNKAIKEKNREVGIKQQDNIDSEKNENEEQQHVSLAAQAYKLFSDRKSPLEVAIALNLRESEATKFYKEYWKLKQLHNLNMVYEETKDDIEPFLNLYRLSKAAGMNAQQIVNLLKMSNNSIFKSNNEEYLKIKQEAEEKVKSVLTDSKLLLQFALASVIEALRRKPETCNSVLYNISNNTLLLLMDLTIFR